MCSTPAATTAAISSGERVLEAAINVTAAGSRPARAAAAAISARTRSIRSRRSGIGDEPDRGAEPAGREAERPVREEGVGLTARADAGDLDAVFRHARRDELAAVDLPEVDVRSAVRPKRRGFRGPGNLIDHVRSDLEAARPD